MGAETGDLTRSQSRSQPGPDYSRPAIFPTKGPESAGKWPETPPVPVEARLSKSSIDGVFSLVPF